MKKRNLLSLLLALAIVFSSLAPIFAKEAITDMQQVGQRSIWKQL